jgi:hypothetical protein
MVAAKLRITGINTSLIAATIATSPITAFSGSRLNKSTKPYKRVLNASSNFREAKSPSASTITRIPIPNPGNANAIASIPIVANAPTNNTIGNNIFRMDEGSILPISFTNLDTPSTTSSKTLDS